MSIIAECDDFEWYCKGCKQYFTDTDEAYDRECPHCGADVSCEEQGGH